jgi:hypothetical protein
MRRRLLIILTGLVLIGSIAAPASAERTWELGNFPHKTWVHPCAPFCPAEVKELPTGEWADIGNAWATKTEAQRDHFVETVIVEIEGDGVVYGDISPYLFVRDTGFGDAFWAARAVLVHPGVPNETQYWTIRYTFTEDHFDGWDMYTAGTVLEQYRIVVWTPRGDFPSGDYPISDY